MNRQQRRAAARKRAVGTVVNARAVSVVLTTGERQLYWFEEPEGFSPEDGQRVLDCITGLRDDGPGVELLGPFQTDTEVRESQRLTLLGPQWEVTEGGMWDPAWDKPQ
jgi:hypothetical protein